MPARTPKRGRGLRVRVRGLRVRVRVGEAGGVRNRSNSRELVRRPGALVRLTCDVRVDGRDRALDCGDTRLGGVTVWGYAPRGAATCVQFFQCGLYTYFFSVRLRIQPLYIVYIVRSWFVPSDCGAPCERPGLSHDAGPLSLTSERSAPRLPSLNFGRLLLRNRAACAASHSNGGEIFYYIFFSRAVTPYGCS